MEEWIPVGLFLGLALLSAAGNFFNADYERLRPGSRVPWLGFSALFVLGAGIMAAIVVATKWHLVA